MPHLSDLALLSPDAPRFGWAVRKDPAQTWQLRDCKLDLLPLHCRNKRHHLQRSLRVALNAGCRTVALSPDTRAAIREAPLFLADGRLFKLSALPRRLDLDCPGWRKDLVSVCADDNFSCLAARLLAPQVGYIHIYGEDQGRRQALCRLLYRESGLIANQAPNPIADSLLIIPPETPEQLENNGAYPWNNWPTGAITARDIPIPNHLAEGLLLCTGQNPSRERPLQLLHLLSKRSYYQRILPV